MIDACCRRFGIPYFAWDLACSEHDCLGLNGGYTYPSVDALAADWTERAGKGVCWLNPPFAKAGKFCQRAAEAASASGLRTVALVPVALGTRWWRRYVHQRAVVVGVGRVVFNNPDGTPVLGKGGKPQAINRDVAVLAYGFQGACDAPWPAGEWYRLEDWRTW
jgi:hypothetical protein